MSVKQIFNTSAELDYPTVLPTLDLDFANSKTLDPRITFTRASGGSYTGADGLIKLAGVNEARFDHDPVTGESLGLLIEEARTNLLTNSENIDGTGWTKSNSTSTLDAAIAPNGTQTADKLIPNTTNTTHHVECSATVVAGVAYQFSVYLKAAGETTAVLWNNVVGGIFTVNLANGTITEGTGTITNVGGGWYRCSIAYTPAGTNGQVRTYVRQVAAWSGDGTSGLFIWGAQIEQGAFPTSYIPTEASTRTRAADDASITGKNFSEWYRQDEGTFVSKGRSYNFTLSTFPYFLTLDDGTNSNRMGMGYVVSFLGGVFVRNNNVNLVEMYPPVNTNPRTGSFAYKLNDVGTSFNAGNVLIDTSVSIPIVTKMQIGDFGTSLNNIYNLNGTIARLTYYPKRLPNSQLITLTS